MPDYRTAAGPDDLLSPEEAAQISGLEWLKRMIRGEIAGPPISGLLGFRLVEIEEGRALFYFFTVFYCVAFGAIAAAAVAQLARFLYWTGWTLTAPKVMFALLVVEGVVQIAALAVVDATARLVPGVLGDEDSAATDSFATGILDHPHYTRPRELRGMGVPEVLLSGNHAEIEKWRREQAHRRTRRSARPPARSAAHHAA